MYKHIGKAFSLAIGLSMAGAAIAGPGHTAMNEEPAVWHVSNPSPYYHSRSEARAEFRAALRECRSLYRAERRQCLTNARADHNAAIEAARDSRYAYVDSVPQYMLYAPFEGPAIP
jgi:hypothetical protein